MSLGAVTESCVKLTRVERGLGKVGTMAEQGKGLYDYQYGRFRENQGTHQGYEFQHGPAGSTPPPVVTFADKLKWWTLRAWRRKKILAERDRFQQEIIQIKTAHPKP
ncbi:MAG: hypothetical protein OJF47_004234 [Nitrospira sp.]|nr:MAG: hypothetical protein OJF47_004234 [Nitrospira sp.]